MNVLDMIAGRVFGLVQAREVRIVWTDGHLYICKSPSDITVFACDRPARHAGSWVTKVGESQIRFQPPGCGSCRRRVAASPVGQMSVDEIVEAGASVGA